MNKDTKMIIVGMILTFAVFLGAVLLNLKS